MAVFPYNPSERRIATPEVFVCLIQVIWNGIGKVFLIGASVEGHRPPATESAKPCEVAVELYLAIVHALGVEIGRVKIYQVILAFRANHLVWTTNEFYFALIE